MEQGNFRKPSDAIQFIKDGNYEVMGQKVSGDFFFPDIKLANQSRNQLEFIPYGLEQAASEPYASPQTRNFARKLRLAIGPMEDLQNQNRE